MNHYEIETFQSDITPQCRHYRVQAHTAADALVEFDLNVIQKSKVWVDGQFKPTAKIMFIHSVEGPVSVTP